MALLNTFFFILFQCYLLNFDPFNVYYIYGRKIVCIVQSQIMLQAQTYSRNAGFTEEMCPCVYRKYAFRF